jgi:hypothetical protein
VGNGDVSFIYTGNGTNGVKKHSVGATDWQQWIYMSKNDMWGSDAQDYYPHLSAGKVGILVTPPGVGSVTNASVHMFPGNASLTHTLVDPTGDASVRATTRVLENNVVVTTLMCTSKSGKGACKVSLLLADTNQNHYKVNQSTGASPDADLVWWRKENVHETLNSAYLGSCDPHMPLQSTERRFTVDADGGDLRMANGSCLWSDPSVAPGMITSGACSQPQGGWKWAGNASAGDIVHTSSSKCLISASKLGDCGSTPWAGERVESCFFLSFFFRFSFPCIRFRLLNLLVLPRILRTLLVLFLRQPLDFRYTLSWTTFGLSWRCIASSS